MGEIVKTGEWEHKCYGDSERGGGGRPPYSDYPPGTVWRCDCGRFWKTVPSTWYYHSDRSDDWVECKDAKGTEWRREEIHRSEYMRWRVVGIGGLCREHGFVPYQHLHTRRV